ncbi:amidase [Nonomuraea sp. FMUSA5-5]|uniref:Amidase n=1 Tax=Nonomuraea composti TaxID=2720023 RepID=A0ABX1B7Q7_9ACTN|nr:amidase [Nonomuraea sp. FMUSA5-5]NJP93849.1 amidase [Nonomuraea sp. FMUSA5-5]
MSLVEMTVAEASAALARREVSPVELTDAVLARLDAVDGTLHAYATVIAETARASAAEAEREIAAGRYRGPLHGVPFGLKDLIDVAGLPTGAGSKVRQGHLAASDGAVAARLSEAGAILVGKTHTHEFAYGLTTPQTRNAWDPGRVAGGSSGGSAVAVASGTALFALGTDTGGSIRVPAALNGVVGLKPTYGLVSRHGVVPLSWSLDHVGPITRTVADAGLVLPALAGHDPRDPASLPGAAFQAEEREGLRGLRVGVPVNHYVEHVDPAVEAAVRAAVARLEELGARLVEIEIPYARFLQATQWGLMVPEATAYHEPTLRSSPELYAPDVRVLLEAGALIPAADHVRARRARSLMRLAWSQLFERVDVIAAPATPITAAPAGQDSVTWPDGTVEAVSDAYVRLSAPANITGVPALTLPAGHDAAGLPIGLQLMGPALGESLLLSVGRACERALDRAGALAPVAA